MKELLEEFCRLVPKDMEAELSDESEVVCYCDGDAWMSFEITDDHASAEALVFFLDWLEGQGREGTLEPLYAFGGGKQSRVCGYRYLGRKNIIGNGKTRIEAVVRACVEVLRSPQPPSSEPDQSTPPQDLKR